MQQEEDEEMEAKKKPSIKQGEHNIINLRNVVNLEELASEMS